jgi:hypothetical protein
MAKNKKLVRFTWDDKRRPKPDIALRYTRVTRPPESLFSLREFEAMVQRGSITDDDGEGYYGSDIIYTNQYAHPSDIRRGFVDRFWTHVMWFNK